MGTRGGARPGAGRKKGAASIKAEEARKYLNERVAAEIEDIVAGQIELAKGIYSEVETDEGYRRIYRKLPDSKAAEYLLNQVIGRAKESIDMNLKPVFSLIELNKGRMALPVKSIEEMDMLEDAEDDAPASMDPAEREAYKARHPEMKEVFDAIKF